MTYEEIYTTLCSAGLDVAYYSFPEEEAPDLPYLVYFYPTSRNFTADGVVYQKRLELDVELYTDSKDFDAEAAVETVLTAAGFLWEKAENYIDSERMYQIIYTMEVLIDE